MGFFGKHPFWISLILVIVLSALLFAGIFLGLNVLTQHGRSVKVPNLAGLTLSQADAKLREVSLKYEIIDSIYSEDHKPGTVVEIIPSAGKPVKPNRHIFLIVNATSPKPAVIPHLTDTSERQALATLKSLGFVDISVEYIPGVYDGLVQGVRIKGQGKVTQGERVPITSPLVLMVSKVGAAALTDSMGILVPDASADDLTAPADSTSPAPAPNPAGATEEETTSNDDESWW